MLDALIRFSLRQRPLVLGAALVIIVFGWHTVRQLTIEVLPEMTKPTVTVLTEAPGLAPEEVEALVTRPIELALQGVTGIDRLRSSSDVGLSLVFAEFGWDAEIHRARQLVQERLQASSGNLPRNVQPELTPISSLMGEILLVGLRSTDADMPVRELRALADWTVARRLQAIPGVAQVLAIGGGVTQVLVQPDPHRLAAHNVSLAELEAAVANAAGTSTSGYLVTPAREYMVRNLAMTADLGELGRTVVKGEGVRRILIEDVATVVHAVQAMRGDASVNGLPGVILSIDKAPGFDTRQLTATIERALEDLRHSLPPGVETEVLFRQSDFIGHAIGNLQEAIRDGAIIVAIVLFLFLLNFRTTLITLTAIPLSFAVTVLMFRWLDVTVNSMSLGGLAVAIGMVVDDAIVDVENVYRRLRENAAKAAPRPALEVVAEASAEVRNSILYATLLVMLVFLPLLALEGLEGRLFTPIAFATMTSMAASFVVALTVIPVLCSLLLKPRTGEVRGDAWLVRGLKWLVERTVLRFALAQPFIVLAAVGILFAAALALYPVMGKEFLPAFNEGSATISMAAAPGTSLVQANELGEIGAKLLLGIPEVKSVGRRAGRAEKDDHVMPVSVNEFDVEFHDSGRSRAEVFRDIRERLGGIPGVFINLGQPIGHRLSHMLSGVSSTIAVKVFGPELGELRRLGQRIESISKTVPGITDVHLEAQAAIPQLRIEVNRERAAAYGVQPGALSEQLGMLIGGKTVAQLRDGERTLDFVLRLPEELRSSPEQLRNLLIETGEGERLPLRLVAAVQEASGPNVISRDNAARRIVIGANTTQRDLQEVVRRLQSEIAANVELPQGYHLSFEGEFQAQQEATRRILLFSAMVVVVIALLLYGYFRSAALTALVLVNIPLALMGGLALTWLLINNISVATLVGFIAVGGIAARNGIMMISHYLHLMKHEGMSFGRALVIRGTLERLVPVSMTALSAGAALIPLLLAAGAPGKEILHPVAVVIVGGLISSTLLDFLVTPAVFLHFGRRASEAALEFESSATHA